MAAAGGSNPCSRETSPPRRTDCQHPSQTSPDRALGGEAAAVDTPRPRMENWLQGSLGESCLSLPSPVWLDWARVRTNATLGIVLFCVFRNAPSSTSTLCPGSEGRHGAGGRPHLTPPTRLRRGFWSDSRGPRLPWKEEGSSIVRLRLTSGDSNSALPAPPHTAHRQSLLTDRALGLKTRVYF